MEPKEKQVRKVLDKVHGFVQKWWPVAMVICMAAMAVMLMTGCRCTAAAYGTQRTTKDSVAIRYRTVMRDSVRIKDSTVVSYSLRQRDSVVLRVDAQTGKVVGRDTWHWRDNEASREHFGSVERATSKGDSLSLVSVRTDSVRVPVPVERKLSKWERICQTVKDILSILGAIAMAVFITWIVVELLNEKRKIL